jgi:glycosyltransferase involved in cell wall biosynthesis
MQRVAAFTDTYLPTVNGVTYTVQTWRERWHQRGGRMDVVFPDAPAYDPDGEREHPTRSVGFPFYEGFRFGLPGVPEPVKRSEPEVVHAHTPFGLGLSALYLARRIDAPLVASYHTPTAEYADYLAKGPVATAVEGTARRYERWFMNRADVVVAPSEPARDHLREIGVSTPVRIVPNGVDAEFFSPVDTAQVAAFRDRHGLPDGPLVGYTGRHGYEKNLTEIPPAVAAADADPTLVFGGEGPAREEVEAAAAETDVDTRFLGFLDREELPTFYSALDAFLFPSPVETQGLVALEANACGTPVVGVDAGALADTVEDGTNGLHFPEGDTAAFAAAVDRVLAEADQFRENCLAYRGTASATHAVDVLADVYDDANSLR